jgi:EmrB/QacA subfamily drug resistance transporter
MPQPGPVQPGRTEAALVEEPAPAPDPSRTRLIALIVATALFMQNLDGTVVATALPTMAQAFGADPLHMNVALTSYLLSLAVFIPVSGWMADRYGAKTVFRAAIAVFTVGSVLCGMADTLTALVLARIVQGIGGAMMVPVGRLLLLRSVAKSELVAAMAWLTTPALIGPVVGPPLGGFLVEYANWRWIFDINVPIGVLGIVLVTLFVPDSREPSPGRLDSVGLVLSGLALACLMLGFETAGRGVLAAPAVAGLLASGIAAGALYLWHSRRVIAAGTSPLLDLTLMLIPTFAVSVTAGSLFRIGVGAIPFLLPLMLQLGFGLSPIQSGMITFASAVGAIAMKPAAQYALRTFGFRMTLGWNGLAGAVLLAMMGFYRPSWPLLALYTALILGGFLRSLQFTAYNTIAYADIPRERMSAATSLYSTLQQLSLTLGITVGAAALQFATAVTGRAAPSLADFTLAFLTVAVFSLAAAPLAFRLPDTAGAEMSGHRTRRA